MRLTTSQVFQIGSAMIGFGTLVASLYLDPKIVATIGGGLATCWGTIGGIITTPQAQANDVAKHIDDPTVKSAVLPAVSQLPGLEPLRVNANADATTIALAASNTPANAKIEFK